jgi:RecB family exonuclease
VELSFSQLHDFEVCPVRYRFSQVWRVPAPPDELQPRFVQAMGSTELGASVHAALATWHVSGGDLLRLYSGPEAGREMLARYLSHPLASAATLAVEVGFNMRIGATRVRGLVDRICEVEGRTVLVDYKTNASLDASLLEAYSMQLRLYGLAARRGLVPGGPDARLLLFDLRRGEVRDVAPDDAGVEARVTAAAARIGAGDFSLRPEHDQRPCTICAFRPICPDRRH